MANEHYRPHRAPDPPHPVGGKLEPSLIEPMTILLPPSEIPPNMLRGVKVENGALIFDTPKGPIGLELYALPAAEGGQTSFLQRIFGRKPTQQPAPVRVEIRPPIPSDEFQRGVHTPLMGQQPYVILQPKTRYAVVITAPTYLHSHLGLNQKNDQKYLMI